MSDVTPKMRSLFGGESSGGFLGVPIAAQGDCADADIVVLGAPSATPYLSVGPYCADAPTAIRSAFGWPGVLDHYDFDLGGQLLADGTQSVDWGNLDYHASDFESNRITIRDSVQSILAAGARPIVLGGDDSVPIPVLQAFERHGPITVLQIDAHIDWRDEVAGEKMGLSSTMRRTSEMGWVRNIIQVGARGTGSARPSDYQDALDWGVDFFPMETVVENGLRSVIEAIPTGEKLFITLDIDGLDPAIVPAVIGPAPGGLSYWQAVTLLKGAAHRADIIGFDLVELMPANDIGDRGALVAARLTALVMGLMSRQVIETQTSQN